MNMKMKGAARVLAVACAAAALPIMVASPASADQGDCQYSLHEAGYQIGPKVEAACKTGANTWNPGRFIQCFWGLTAIGVREEHAVTACQAA
ncbi:hypothetical protein OG765_23580 [Streptomyces sp. NBC_00555]|uniref:hypothetical protein n=1 Tax=Streptomyces sp. NBC_00555 TaxID=2903662 RepID=UPI00224D77FB|nr:hypothetical protein [Streptomyces sp. NBC_00555]MCX5013946.1 hypothetical protein [Streptomyces sp. NBC_00555]